MSREFNKENRSENKRSRRREGYDSKPERPHRTPRTKSTKTKLFDEFASFFFEEKEEKNDTRKEKNTSSLPRRDRPDSKKRERDNTKPLSKQKDENKNPFTKTNFNQEDEIDISNLPWNKGKKSKEEPKPKRSPRKRIEATPLEKEPLDKPNIMRLNKYVAKTGLCSRRKAAELVKAGEIIVNGNIELNPAYEMQENDVVEYKGNVLTPEEKLVYLLLNKPKGYITTVDDEKDRKTVMDLVSDKIDVRAFPVGRLDRNTTGLLLITNDGELSKKLTHPSHQIQKFYHVVLDKTVSEEDLELIRKGLTLDDGDVEVDAVDYIGGKVGNEVGIEIHLGRNRIVRRIFEHLGYVVEKLDRTYFAGLTKKDLPRGWSRELTSKEIIMLKHFTGS